ncbi:MAG: hypothetical protein KA185_07010 [Vitreoscilla sp.]|nr:hypothetical protein [Vitreoscilla sp.]
MKAHMDPHQQNALAVFVQEFGSLLVAGVIGFVGWVMARFTDQHIKSMQDMTAEVAKINVKVASIDANVSAIGKRQDEQAERIKTLEDNERAR